MSHPQFYDISSVPDPYIYSHAVSFSGPTRFVVASGQLGHRADGSYPESRVEEFRQALRNIAAVFKAGGADMQDVIKMTILIVDWEFEEAAQLWAQPLEGISQTRLGIDIRPTTTLIPVSKLGTAGARFEIEGMAVAGGASSVWTDNVLTGRIERTPGPAKVDVVVVGAGLSGLQTAWDLHQAGLSCLVLEAGPRIGGRSRSFELAGGRGVVETGTSLINKTTQPKVYALAQELGLECIPQREEGKTIWQSVDGRTWRVEPNVLPSCPFSDQYSRGDLERFVQLLGEEQSKIDLHSPSSLDPDVDMSVQAWIEKQNFTPWTGEAISHFTATKTGCEARHVGLHFFADYVKCSGGLDGLVSGIERGAQSLRIAQGTTAIAEGMARRLPPGSIRLNTPVNVIRQTNTNTTDGEVIVITQSGFEVHCKRVVLAAPVYACQQIAFTPPLPQAKRALATRSMLGHFATASLTYREPWWRALGLSGAFMSTKGPINSSWDTSNDDTADGKGEGKCRYSLSLFLHGDSAERWSRLPSRLAKEAALLDHLVELVGPEHEDAIVDVDEVVFVDSSLEEWIGGAPTVALGLGDLARYGGALRERFGRVHFGGTETAFEWKGYLEGALGSGQKVAEEIVKAFKG